MNELRPRRLRSTRVIRDLVQDVPLSLSQLIQPYFLKEGNGPEEPIDGFTGVSRWSVDSLLKKVEADLERNIRAFLLFGEVPQNKRDAVGSELTREESLIPHALIQLKKRFAENALFFTDVCLCPATDHGHCGVVDKDAVHNDASLERLSQIALVHAEAGADFVAPSDMMDGRIGAIRHFLDQKGHADVGILAYTAKYASNYYGPFRSALDSSPKAGALALSNRATYQMDYRRGNREALRELRLDTAEGADLVMVKPALAYLDVIAHYRANSELPVVAYSVSGEYEMVKCMAASGLVDEKSMALENLWAIRRAGADIIISYFASQAAEMGWLK